MFLTAKEQVVDDATLTKLKALITDANVLAGSDHVMVRVAGERIATLLADLLYEIDIALPDVVSLLPQVRRDTR